MGWLPYALGAVLVAQFAGLGAWQVSRAQEKRAVQDAFDQQAFHDFVLDQGMLPPDILKAAVMDEFVPSQLH